MKLKLFTIIGFALTCSATTIAQCNVTIPDSNSVSVPLLIVTSDTVINVDPGTYQQDFLICPGVSLTYNGNQSAFCNYYLEEGASVELISYHYANIYLKDNSSLDGGQSESPSVFLQEIYYESGAIMTDTSGHFATMTSCTPLTFDYSLLPGGVGCPGVAGSLELPDFNFKIYPNPSQTSTTVEYNALQTVENAEMKIYNETGKVVGVYSLNPSQNQLIIDISDLPAGIYYYAFEFDGEIVHRQIVSIIH